MSVYKMGGCVFNEAHIKKYRFHSIFHYTFRVIYGEITSEKIFYNESFVDLRHLPSMDRLIHKYHRNRKRAPHMNIFFWNTGESRAHIYEAMGNGSITKSVNKTVNVE